MKGAKKTGYTTSESESLFYFVRSGLSYLVCQDRSTLLSILFYFCCPRTHFRQGTSFSCWTGVLTFFFSPKHILPLLLLHHIGALCQGQTNKTTLQPSFPQTNKSPIGMCPSFRMSSHLHITCMSLFPIDSGKTWAVDLGIDGYGPLATVHSTITYRFKTETKRGRIR